MAVDWLKIKTEYINDTSTSYKKLAAKHSVPYPTLRDRAVKEGWKAERDEQRNKVVTETVQKTAEKISESLSDEAASKARIRAKLLKMSENWVDAQGEQIEDTADFRRMVQCLVDLGITEGQGEDSTGVQIIDDL